MAATPMEEPAALSCGDQQLHWDRIGQIWLCARCGASLRYTSWSCGKSIDCRADAIERPRSLAIRHFRHHRPR